ncbi:MAG: hypothetical protein JWN46_3412 [Acidimicrobiales bacterium]|nr:hypothetical protein [Acidimicrobiales bacterium]
MAERSWRHDDVARWFSTRVAPEWFDGPVEVRIDRDEILVTGWLPPHRVAGRNGPGGGVERIEQFRNDTRAARTAVAAEAETLWKRKVSWGVRCGDHEVHFTSAAVPVMTRLRIDERAVLDTLIAAGVAGSRSEALAWCVRLVGEHEAAWIEQLRTALDAVAQARAAGPTRAEPTH